MKKKFSRQVKGLVPDAPHASLTVSLCFSARFIISDNNRKNPLIDNF